MCCDGRNANTGAYAKPSKPVAEPVASAAPPSRIREAVAMKNKGCTERPITLADGAPKAASGSSIENPDGGNGIYVDTRKLQVADGTARVQATGLSCKTTHCRREREDSMMPICSQCDGHSDDNRFNRSAKIRMPVCPQRGGHSNDNRLSRSESGQ